MGAMLSHRVAFCLALLGCGGTATEPVAPAGSAAPPDTPAQEDPAEEQVEALQRLLIMSDKIRMSDCGHDGDVGELHCAYTVTGEHRPAQPQNVLRLFVTEEPALMLVATDFEPARMVGDAEVLMADCEYEARGELTDFHVGAVAGVSGYLYTGTVRVGVATQCSFDRADPLPERLNASHLVVFHDGSASKSRARRSRDEALARATMASADGGPFAQLVARYSDEPGAAERSGKLGDFKLGMMAAEFELIVLSTPIGQRSPVFETSFGFHILERHAPKK
jgi:hypothetical protein